MDMCITCKREKARILKKGVLRGGSAHGTRPNSNPLLYNHHVGSQGAILMLMRKKKQILVPVTVAMHTKLKWEARQRGQSMSHIVRELIEEFLDGEIGPAPDVYDQLAAKVERAVQ